MVSTEGNEHVDSFGMLPLLFRRDKNGLLQTITEHNRQSMDQSAVNPGDSDNLSLWQMGRSAAASMYQQLIYHFHIR